MNFGSIRPLLSFHFGFIFIPSPIISIYLSCSIVSLQGCIHFHTFQTSTFLLLYEENHTFCKITLTEKTLLFHSFYILFTIPFRSFRRHWSISSRAILHSHFWHPFFTFLAPFGIPWRHLPLLFSENVSNENSIHGPGRRREPVFGCHFRTPSSGIDFCYILDGVGCIFH